MGRRLVASSSEVGGTQRDGNASSRGISGHPEVGGCWARTDGETDAKSTIATTLKDRRFIEFTPPINFAVRLKAGDSLRTTALQVMSIRCGQQRRMADFAPVTALPNPLRGRRRALR